MQNRAAEFEAEHRANEPAESDDERLLHERSLAA
jgi:hypothetical protein